MLSQSISEHRCEATNRELICDWLHPHAESKEMKEEHSSLGWQNRDSRHRRENRSGVEAVCFSCAPIPDWTVASGKGGRLAKFSYHLRLLACPDKMARWWHLQLVKVSSQDERRRELWLRNVSSLSGIFFLGGVVHTPPLTSGSASSQISSAHPRHLLETT